MKFLERKVVELLIAEAAKDGFVPWRFACTPATGEEGDEIEAPALTAAQCFEHANAWDSDSVIEFANADGREFWALLIWGNGEDLISDYLATKAAGAIVKRVYEEVEA